MQIKEELQAFAREHLDVTKDQEAFEKVLMFLGSKQLPVMNKNVRDRFDVMIARLHGLLVLVDDAPIRQEEIEAEEVVAEVEPKPVKKMRSKKR